MYRSVEMLMIREFTLDFVTLAAALRPVRRLRLKRLISAAAAGALFAGLLLPMALPEAVKNFLSICWTAVMARMAAGPGHRGAGAAVLALSALGYALSRPFQGNSLLAAGTYCLSALGSSLILNRKRRWQANWRVEIRLEWRGRAAAFPALIDTGNRLREVAFGGVGGSGVMGCFCPEALKFDGAEAGEAFWVAVYPGPLPGGAGALAPPECMEYFAGKDRKHQSKEECSCRAPNP